MYSIMTMDLLYGLALWSMCVWKGFRSNGFVTEMQSFLINGYYRIDDISGVSHPKSGSVVSLVLCMVCCAIVGAPILYFRSLGTASTLLRMGNISGIPYY
jgi:hypothetical protein